MEDNGILEATELMQVTLDLSVYRQTLAYALGNLAIMILLSSGLLIIQSFIDSYPIIILLWVLLTVFAVLVHVYVFRNVLRRVNLGISIYSYPIVLMMGYGINFLINNPIPVDFLWYPLIGVCNIIVGLTSETTYYKKNQLFSRPLLINGVMLVLSTPILLIILLLVLNEPNNIIAPGCALIITSLTTSYTMALAEKRVVNK